VGEIAVALGLALLGYLCLHISWIYGAVLLALVLGSMAGCAVLIMRGLRRITRLQPV
jgi:TctA family transporter